MLDHVLVPLDGSHLAEEALQPAMKLLVPHGKLTLVNAIDVPYNWSYGIHPLVSEGEYRQLFDDLLPEASNYLEEIAAKLRGREFEVDVLTQFGEASLLILDVAAERKVDAIVMTTHGRTGVSRWLFGSVTGKVLSAAECPVLVVPSKEHTRHSADEPITNVLESN